MDFFLSIVQLSEKDHRRYMDEIRKSNLPKDIQCELIDLLNTALQQTKQARSQGWIS